MYYQISRNSRLVYPSFFFSIVMLLPCCVIADSFNEPTQKHDKLIENDAYDLSKLIAFGLKNSPDIIISDYVNQAAKAKERVAYGAMLPQLSFESAYTKYSDDQRLKSATYNGETGVFGDRLMTNDLVMKIPIYTGGKLTSQYKSAEKSSLSTRIQFEKSKENLIYNISVLYFSYLAQREMNLSLESSVEVMKSELNKINMLIASRKLPEIDRFRAESTLSEYQQRLLRSENNLKIQHNLILNVIGGNHIRKDFLISGSLNLPEKERGDVDVTVDKALKTNADIRSTFANIEAQIYQVDAANAEHKPTINLIGSAGLRNLSGISKQAGNANSNEDNWKVGLTLSLPLYQGGQTSARIQEENALLSVKKYQLEKLKMQIHSDISSAIDSLNSAIDEAAVSIRSVTLERKKLEIERIKYKSGQGILLDVLSAQNDLIEAETNYVQSVSNANIAKARLDWLKGEY